MWAVETTRWFLAIFFSGVAGFYILRILFVKRKLERSPVYSGERGTSHFLTHGAFRGFRFAILSICVARLLWPVLDKYLIPIDALWYPIVLMSGNLLLLICFFCVVLVHFYMGDTWRSGTRLGDNIELIVTGPFKWSRNPMMIGVLGAQAGLFLALPTVFTLICFVVGVWAVVVQIRVEEQLLKLRFGEKYQHYTEATPRWIILR